MAGVGHQNHTAGHRARDVHTISVAATTIARRLRLALAAGILPVLLTLPESRHAGGL